MTPLEIRNSALKLYVSNGILLVTSVFAFCPQKSLMTENDRDLNDRKERIFHSYFFTLNNVIMCFFHFFICTFA